MKKIILSFLFICSGFYGYGQAYKPISISRAEYNTHNSYSGIDINGITPQADGSYMVEFYNTNYNDPYDGVSYYTSYSFEWYLSYKGKRVSDYYKSTIRCRKSESKSVYSWPNEVPKGYERYVTVQFGREQVKVYKDRRDDF